MTLDRTPEPDPERRDRSRVTLLGLGVVALVAGFVLAYTVRWTCDDAFISFRYARNLVRGLGLVFNAGERVEGYTNPAWTLWIAGGLRLGVDAVTWSYVGSLAALMAAVGLMTAFSLRAPTRRGVPVAALVFALDPDVREWATSGLETMPVTALALAGLYALAPDRPDRPEHRHPVRAGLLFGLAAITRHDALLFGVVAWLYLASARRADPARSLRPLVTFSAAFALVWGSVSLARVAYYGDFFPNTYYAKSGGEAWWSQGWVYLGTYVQGHPVTTVGLAVLGGVVVASRWRRPGSSTRSASRPEHASGRHLTVVACAMAGVHGLYVVRVGGDFMYARMLVPASAFAAIAFEGALFMVLDRVSALRRDVVVAVATVVAAAVPWLVGRPVGSAPETWVGGITHERGYYPPELTAQQVEFAGRFGRTLNGLPVRVAFMGGEARVVYYADFEYAIEATAGLTEPTLARRALEGRGRVGHEKTATTRWLVGEREAHLVFHPRAAEYMPLDEDLPPWSVKVDGVPARLLRWDPELMPRLAERGVTFHDFPSQLDRLIAALDRAPDEVVAREWERARLFYFDHVDDPARRAAFERRLAPAEAR